jgi:CRP/FNR family cyclic AMP-dependent transcriptional regulator
MSAISDLFRKGTTVQFKKNDFFISPKKEPQGIYHIKEGFVYSYSQSPSHKKRIQTILKKGDIFPIAWTINNNNARKDMYVQAFTDGLADKIEKKVFVDYINNSQEAALEVVDVLLMYLSIYVDRVENLEEDTVRAKLINRLLFFASRFGFTKGRNVYIDLPLTHNLIAESISVSRENVTREMKALENKKVISFNKHQLVITDIKHLKKELLK